MNKNIYICPTPELEEAAGKDVIASKLSGSAYSGSAGLDLYCSKDVVFSLTPETCLIDTGIRMIIPQGYVGIIKERSSIGKAPLRIFERDLILRAGVIDSDYRGVIKVKVSHPHFEDYEGYSAGDRLPYQLIVVKCSSQYRLVTPHEFSDLDDFSTERFEKGFGSSN
jgi:dUTP pyrophosphatase